MLKNKRFSAKIIKTTKESDLMNIALIAHDSKKELMTQFCIAYCGILSKHSICATGTTGKLVAEATGLNIEKYLSGSQGGAQQIGATVGIAA